MLPTSLNFSSLRQDARTPNIFYNLGKLMKIFLENKDCINNEKHPQILPLPQKKLKTCTHNGVSYTYFGSCTTMAKKNDRVFIIFIAILVTLISLGFALFSKKVRCNLQGKVIAHFYCLRKRPLPFNETIRKAQIESKLGHSYRLEKNYVKALEHYQKAASLNYAPAQFSVGYCFDEGLGTEKNPIEAVRWYKKSADQNYPPAENNLAYCLRHGIGTEKQPAEALELYIKAANQNYLPAQQNLNRILNA